MTTYTTSDDNQTQYILAMTKGSIASLKVVLAHVNKHIKDPQLVEFLVKEIGTQERIWDRNFNKLSVQSPTVRRLNGRPSI